MKIGAFDYLMKPCDMDTLIEKVNEAAKRKRDQEEKIMEAKMQAITLRRP
jgi:DNA-binding NtrC family response regulator